MGKVVKKILIGVAIGIAIFITYGAATHAILGYSFLGLSGASAIVAAGAAMGALSAAAQLFVQKPNADMGASTGRLHASLNPNAHGKWVFGETACATDLVYAEKITDGDNEDIFQLFAAASHLIDSFGDFYLNDELIGFTGEDAGGGWNGVLKRILRLGTEVQTAIIPTGSAHPSAANGRGIAQFGLVYNLNEGQKSKITSGIPTRITQVVKGAPVYDPRLDSTRGGSGAHRADDQSTWEYSNGGIDIGANWALIVLFYLIGWRNNSILVFGVGADLNDIDYDQAIAAANVCEEVDITTRRYFIGGILPTTNSHERIISQLESVIGGKVARVGGKYFIWAPNDDLISDGTINNNDLVADIGVDFSPSANLAVLKNTARGVFISPTDLFQQIPYPDIVEATAVADDGRERILRHDFALIQEQKRAERVARMLVRRSRFTGSWKFATGPKGLLFQPFDIITINFPETDDLDIDVRIINMEYGPLGVVAMEVIEEDSSIYDTSAALGTPITQLDPFAFDPTLKVAVTGLLAVATSITGQFSRSDAIKVTWDNPGGAVGFTEVQHRLSGTTEWQTVTPERSDFLEAIIGGVESCALYEVRARHITIIGVVGDFSAIVEVRTSAETQSFNTANVGDRISDDLNDQSFGGHSALDERERVSKGQGGYEDAPRFSAPIYSGLDAGTLLINTETGRITDALEYVSGFSIDALEPFEPLADVTSANTSSGITGQGDLATQDQADWDTDISNRPTELTDGRVAAGLAVNGDVARTVPNAEVSSASVTQHEGDINHDNLSAFVASHHVDHSAVEITAGAGLTGGGTIESTRTVDVGAGVGIAVNTDDVAVDFRIAEATVQTTDATTTTLQTIAITSGDQRLLHVRGYAHESATDDMIWFFFRVGVKNVGGTVSIIGTVALDTGSDAGASGWTMVATASSGNVLIEVTGEAAHTIDWSATTTNDPV